MRLLQGDLRDQYTDSTGVTVVMVGHQVLLLSAVASEVLRCLSDEPVDLASIAPHVLAVMGKPPAGVNPEELLAVLATDLAQSGVVEIVS